MGLRVNTNISSLNAQRNLVNVTDRLSGNFSRLASGLRIASASDDAAGLGISERMRAQMRSLTQAARNGHGALLHALAEVRIHLACELFRALTLALRRREAVYADHPQPPARQS